MRPFIVSVIVTTFNEGRSIAACLESVKNSLFRQDALEIIVVDNNSSDGTKEISRLYTDKVFDFGPERSAQRNFGARTASGRYILYLDADMRLSEGVISECLFKCDNEGYAALYIPEVITGEGFWIKARNFERGFYNATVIDCVRFVSRKNFLEAGGFDETLTGPEDWDFDRRARKISRVGIIKGPIYHQEGRFDIKKYIAKKSYYSKSFGAYKNKWGADDEVIKKQFGFWYRYFGVFLERGKWLRLLRHPVLGLAMYFLRIRVGLAYLSAKGAEL